MSMDWSEFDIIILIVTIIRLSLLLSAQLIDDEYFTRTVWIATKLMNSSFVPDFTFYL